MQCLARAIPATAVVASDPVRLSTDVFASLHTGLHAVGRGAVALLPLDDPALTVAYKRESARRSRASAARFM